MRFVSTSRRTIRQLRPERSRIERAIRRLEVLPLSARPGRVPGTRVLAVPGLPYVVIHRVRDDWIDIIAVLHTARNRRR